MTVIRATSGLYSCPRGAKSRTQNPASGPRGRARSPRCYLLPVSGSWRESNPRPTGPQPCARPDRYQSPRAWGSSHRITSRGAGAPIAVVNAGLSPVETRAVRGIFTRTRARFARERQPRGGGAGGASKDTPTGASQLVYNGCKSSATAMAGGAPGATAGSAVTVGTGLSHLQVPTAVIVGPVFGAAGSGAAAQQSLGWSGSSRLAQQLGLAFGLGASASGFLVQQHADAARSTGKQAHETDAHAPAVGSVVRFEARAAGNAATGVSWPRRAKTASAGRR